MGDFPCRGARTGHSSQGGCKRDSSSLSGTFLCQATDLRVLLPKAHTLIGFPSSRDLLDALGWRAEHHICATAAWLSSDHLHVLAKLQWGCTLRSSCSQELRCICGPSIARVPQLDGLRPQQQAAPPWATRILLLLHPTLTLPCKIGTLGVYLRCPVSCRCLI